MEFRGHGKTAVLAGPVVYAVGYPVHGASILRRVSVPTGAVTASITLPGCVGGASVSNGALAVLSESDANCATATSLRLLDPITLRTIWERPVPASGDVLARTNGIYVSQKGHISIYDDNTLAFARSVAIDSSPPLYAGVYLAADPDSDVLWAGIASDRYPVMDAVSLITYRVLSRTPLEAVTAGLPQGMGDDTWVIYATGMLSAVELITSTGHVVARLGGIGANYAVEQVTGRHVWTGFALDDALSLSCRSLISGGVQENTPPRPARRPALSALTMATSTSPWQTNSVSTGPSGPAGRSWSAPAMPAAARVSVCRASTGNPPPARSNGGVSGCSRRVSEITDCAASGTIARC